MGPEDLRPPGGARPAVSGQKRSREPDGSDADDEGDTRSRGPRRTKRPALKKPLKMRLCGVKKENLTGEQLLVREKLQVSFQHMPRKLRDVLTGLCKGPCSGGTPVAHRDHEERLPGRDYSDQRDGA